jgi:hypothetical protein
MSRDGSTAKAARSGRGADRQHVTQTVKGKELPALWLPDAADSLQ